MVKTIAPSARKPNFAGWANDIRLMRERDGRNHRDMCVLSAGPARTTSGPVTC
ncbi:putative replication protein O [Escherichia coli 10.0821]|nr:putative replication protein O [Escherichia coli 10.0821]